MEIVYATLQVKSHIAPAEVEDAVENITSVKRLLDNTPRSYARIGGGGVEMGEITSKPYGAIFAFSATEDLSQLGEAFWDTNMRIPVVDDRCDALLILDRAIISWCDPKTKKIMPRAALAPNALTVAEGADAFLFFYLALHEALATYPAPEFLARAYAAGVRLKSSGGWAN